MPGHTVERCVDLAMSARENLAGPLDAETRASTEQIIGQIEQYLADNAGEVAAARDRLAQRQDADGRALLAGLNELVEPRS